MPLVAQRTLLAIHAHPDDESSKGAGTLAKYADEGARTVVVTCTDGAAGEILNPAMDQPGYLERMVELRREELAKALEVLNVSSHHWLGYRDSGMPETEPNKHPEAFANAPLEEAVGRLVRIIRAERPQVVLCYDESGGYPHPDHIRDHEVSIAAFDAAGDPERYPDAGEPFQPLKLYYYASFSKARVMALNEAMVSRGMDSPFAKWLENWDDEEEGRPEPSITTRIHTARWLPQTRDALLAHATQIDPNSFWFAIPEAVIAEIYPWEDYTLAKSFVPGPGPREGEIEDDLFAGTGA